MVNNQMLQDVFQTFSRLQEKYPRIQPNLDKCFKEIQAKYAGDQAASRQAKKENIKRLLTKFMDMKHLDISYQICNT